MKIAVNPFKRKTTTCDPIPAKIQKCQPYFCAACQLSFSELPRLHNRSAGHQSKLYEKANKRFNKKQTKGFKHPEPVNSDRRNKEIVEARLILDAAAVSCSNSKRSRMDLVEILKRVLKYGKGDVCESDCVFCCRSFGTKLECDVHILVSHSLQSTALQMLKAKRLLHTIYDPKLTV